MECATACKVNRVHIYHWTILLNWYFHNKLTFIQVKNKHFQSIKTCNLHWSALALTPWTFLYISFHCNVILTLYTAFFVYSDTQIKTVWSQENMEQYTTTSCWSQNIRKTLWRGNTTVRTHKIIMSFRLPSVNNQICAWQYREHVDENASGMPPSILQHRT